MAEAGPVDRNTHLCEELFSLIDEQSTGAVTRGRVAQCGREIHPDAGDRCIFGLLDQIDRASRGVLDFNQFMMFLRALCYAFSSSGFAASASAALSRMRDAARDTWLTKGLRGRSIVTLEPGTIAGLYKAARTSAGGRLSRHCLSPLMSALAPSLTPAERCMVIKVARVNEAGEVPLDELLLLLNSSGAQQHTPHLAFLNPPSTRSPSEGQRELFEEVTVIYPEEEYQQQATWLPQEQAPERGAQGGPLPQPTDKVNALLNENMELRGYSERLRKQLLQATQQVSQYAAALACARGSSVNVAQSAATFMASVSNDLQNYNSQPDLAERCAMLEVELAAARAAKSDVEIEKEDLQRRLAELDGKTEEAERAQRSLEELKARLESQTAEAERLREASQEKKGSASTAAPTPAPDPPKPPPGDRDLRSRSEGLRKEAETLLLDTPWPPPKEVVHRLLDSYHDLAGAYDSKVGETKRRLHQHIRRVQQAEQEFIRLAERVDENNAVLEGQRQRQQQQEHDQSVKQEPPQSQRMPPRQHGPMKPSHPSPSPSSYLERIPDALYDIQEALVTLASPAHRRAASPRRQVNREVDPRHPPHQQHTPRSRQPSTRASPGKESRNWSPPPRPRRAPSIGRRAAYDNL